jgi:hypothetical protein
VREKACKVRYGAGLIDLSSLLSRTVDMFHVVAETAEPLPALCDVHVVDRVHFIHSITISCRTRDGMIHGLEAVAGCH